LFLTQRCEDAKAFSTGSGEINPKIAEKPRCQHRANVKCFGHSMSEFKYACPVCGQHMMCDSSQSGSVMECPTCFQKITVPQAPSSDEQKFILTGSKVSEKKYSLPINEGGIISLEKKSPVAAIVTVIFILAAAGAGYVFFNQQHSGEKSRWHTPVAASVAASAWQSGDIGAVGAAGSVSQAGGVFTISGSGADIWHTADGFYYVFQPLNGDGSLTAEILNLQNTDEWAKGGVMIRESTNAGSVFALASLRADGQAQSIWRTATGAEAAASALVGGTGFPKWVKIVRNGNSFTMYFKLNAGDDWAQLGVPQTISMSPKVQIGLFVCAHHAGILSQAQFDQVTLEAPQNGSAASSPAQTNLPLPDSSNLWTLNLGAVGIPDVPVAGKVHGKIFTAERMTLNQDGLTIRTADLPPEAGVTIYLRPNPIESLFGKTVVYDTNSAGAPQVNLRWKDSQGKEAKQSLTAGYALRIEFGQPDGDHVPGKIYFCAPDDAKSYVVGEFKAKIKKPKQTQ
jgi:DNA-directed RNA polymerase subunit RPC12/RpoP